MGHSHPESTLTTEPIRSLRAFLFSLVASLAVMPSHAQEAATVEAPASNGLKESGLGKTAGDDKANRGEFRHPLLFAPEDNGLGLMAPQIKWSFEEGTRADLNGLKLDSSSIALHISQSPRSDTPSRFRGSGSGAVATHLSFGWPGELTGAGTITIEDRKGRALWTGNFNEKDISEWAENIRSAKTDALKVHAKDQWGIFDIADDPFSFLFAGGTFRFCLTRQTSPEDKLKICSSAFSVKSQAQKLIARPAKVDAIEPSVVLHDKFLGSDGIITVPAGKKIDIKVQFSDQAFIEVRSRPVDLKLVDVVESRDGSEVVLTGQGTRPPGKIKVLSEPETHFWAQTGIQQENTWQIALPRQAPILRVLGAFNIPFTLLFDFERLPKESDRVYVRDAPSSGTYLSSPRVLGISPAGSQVSSTETSVKKIDKQKFEWTFAAPKKGQENRAHLLVKDRNGKNSWTTYHNLYHGHSSELSGRLTGITTTSGSVVTIAELAGSQWFETLAGSQSEPFSKQRWGLTGRYTKALSPIKVGNTLTINELTVATLDLKYNFFRGLWNRDQMVGLIFGYEYANLSALSADLIGLGGYWARTMPKILDDLFNIVPFMRYRKYVDVEFIAYPTTITKDLEAGLSYNLNFHGKVFWSETFFGEAGFGFKNFSFQNRAAGTNVSFMTAFGTAGIGIAF